MNTISDHATKLHAIAAVQGFWIGRIVQRWWQAYLSWRLEQAAIAQLSSMSDWELKDIGLNRSEITGAVRSSAARDRTFSRC